MPLTEVRKRSSVLPPLPSEQYTSNSRSLNQTILGGTTADRPDATAVTAVSPGPVTGMTTIPEAVLNAASQVFAVKLYSTAGRELMSTVNRPCLDGKLQVLASAEMAVRSTFAVSNQASRY